MHIDVRVGKAAVFAVDVEVGLHLDALRAHVREFEFAGIVDRAILVREAFETLNRSAIGKSGAFGHNPHIAADEVVGVRQLEPEFDSCFAYNHFVGALLSHVEHRRDVHNEQRIGAATNAVDGERNHVFSRLAVLVRWISLIR